jgi:hypothetical protein
MASIPVEMTAVAGAILTAAEWNTNVRDGINFFLTPPLTILAQAITAGIFGISGSWATMIWDAEIIDRDGMHSMTTNASRLTAQTAGYYDVQGVITYVSNATGARGVRLQINGSNSQGRASACQAANGLWHGQPIASVVFLNIGDYLEMQGVQVSGGSLNASLLSDGSPFITCRWISSS